MDKHAPLKTPPFCPNPKCKSLSSSRPWRFKKKGFFERDIKPHRIQRYLCQHCGRNFSSQTFSVDYWLRNGHLFEPVFHRLVGCSGFRQIAREMKRSHSTIRRLSDRLGRHCLLYHEEMRPKEAPQETLVLDGFRTFEHSQYWPMDLNLAVGKSHFVYGMSDAELRRSGTMRPAQKLKRRLLEKKYGRPDPRATEKSVADLLRRTVPPGATVELQTDEHQSYPRAIRQVDGRHFTHITTSSRAARTPSNPLFPVNVADGLLRHSSSNHKRETIAFSKRRQSVLYRAAIWIVWRNYMKDRSENRRDGPPAKALKLIRRAIEVRELLRCRHFPHQTSVSGWLSDCYFARIKTRAIENCAEHRLKYAM